MVLIGVRAVAAVGAGLCSPAAGTGQRQRYPAVTQRQVSAPHAARRLRGRSTAADTKE